ncbi:MAG: type II toxin-antitoxin system prevent-host-death family antitoxin [Dongiaceae bacterium]
MRRKRKSWSVAEAKARLSSVIDGACVDGPQEITRHGQRTVVVVAAEEWDRKSRRRKSLATFLSESPLRDSGLDLKRMGNMPRKTEL